MLKNNAVKSGWGAVAFALMLSWVPPVGRGQGPGIDPQSQDPRAIMRAVGEQKPEGGNSLARLRMSVKSANGGTQHVLSTRTKQFSDSAKNLIVVEEPADARDTAFLSVDYLKVDTAGEQWLYLPKLHRVTRIPVKGQSEPFLGSDFTYADMRRPNYEDYDLKLIASSVAVDKEECWLIEAVPRTPKIAQQTGYLKSQLWVSKSKLTPLQIKAWEAKDGRLKFIKASNLRQAAGVWTPWMLQAKTMQGSKVASETSLEVLSVEFGASEVTDADFTTRRLEQGA